MKKHNDQTTTTYETIAARTLNELRAIAWQLAQGDITFWDDASANGGEARCCLCGGGMDPDADPIMGDGVKHTSGCAVSRARRVLADVRANGKLDSLRIMGEQPDTTDGRGA